MFKREGRKDHGCFKGIVLKTGWHLLKREIFSKGRLEVLHIN
jgi:hypothetical protein